MTEIAKPWFVFDIDDTLGEFCGQVYMKFNNHFGTRLNPLDNTNYLLAEHFGLTIDDLYHHMKELRVYEDMLPTPGVVEALRYCKQRGLKIHMITARAKAPEAMLITSHWLRSHEIPCDRLTIVTTRCTKATYHSDTTCAVFEDNLKHLTGLKREVTKVLVDRPWNRNAVDDPTIRRVSTMDLPQQIKEIADEYSV